MPKLVVLAIAAFLVLVILVDILEDVMIEGTVSIGSPFSFLFNGIVQFAQGLPATVSSWGYSGIFLLMFLEASSLPFPSEIILPFSGYLVSLGRLSFGGAVLVSTVASMAGSLVDYYIGMKGVNLITKQRTFGKLLNRERLETAERWFNQHGSITVFFSRMVPAFRTLISFPAGATRMPLRRFMVYTLAGCLLWNSVLIYAGLYVGANWQQVASVSHYLIFGAVAIILVTLSVFLVKRKRRKVF